MLPWLSRSTLFPYTTLFRSREGEQASHALNFARLAPDDAPALGGMIADLEEAPIHGYVAPVHVQHHDVARRDARSEEHTSELQSLTNLVCRLLLEKKKKKIT